ncbi:N-acetylneuraminate synthase [Microvirgula aerodenitrificans]|uniref:N-acetylneuraminate synthase n=1 Tax=Microvirgula aerodenitrificans TaxID=57480 RepID=UPI00248DDB3D|nr:N-acetylneuraminate synthase [Microvirgula aerodenitrificans]
MTHTFIIAEAGVNHNGDEALALELVDIAAACGADAVKFQTFRADKLVRPGAEKAEYQKRQTGAGDQHSMLRQLEMSEALHHKLLVRCQLAGIEFMSTPFDEEAADFLITLGMRRIKIPSGEITNHPFLAHLAAKNLPIILSTGMSTMEEILDAIEVIRSVRQQRGFSAPLAKMLTVLHCTSNYPAALKDVNLRAMNTIGQVTGLPIGYSDHTEGITVPIAAVGMRATVIEKHFTLDRNLPGPDHKASLQPNELAAMVVGIREVEQALGGEATKQPSESELQVRALVRRSVTLTSSVLAGQVIGANDLALLRPGNGIAPKEWNRVVGRRAARDLAGGTTLQWSDLA